MPCDRRVLKLSAEIVSVFLLTSSELCRFQLLAFAAIAFNLYSDTKIDASMSSNLEKGFSALDQLKK